MSDLIHVSERMIHAAQAVYKRWADGEWSPAVKLDNEFAIKYFDPRKLGEEIYRAMESERRREVQELIEKQGQ